MARVDDVINALAGSPWLLAALFVLVLGDAFLVILPGETVVTAAAALGASTGTPPVLAVILVAALAAFLGDAACFLIGRRIGLDRWAWMRGRRVQSAFTWARGRLHGNTAVVVFTARFIPFARLAVNLTAGASGLSPARYLGVAAIAASAWAAYQSVVGAVVGLLVPGGPVVAVIVSIVVAIALGLAIDLLLKLRTRRRESSSGS